MTDREGPNPLAQPPGEGFRYSNLAYFLLSMLIEEVTGESLREYARRNPDDKRIGGLIEAVESGKIKINRQPAKATRPATREDRLTGSRRGSQSGA